MGEGSKIEWTDHTFNPWIGCTKVSDGCKNCYAETLMDTRYGRVKWGPQGTRVRTSVANWKKPLAWNRAAEKDTFLHCTKCGWRGFQLQCYGNRLEFCPSCDSQWGLEPARQRVFCASLADVFEDRPELVEWREDLFRLIFLTPNLDWLLLTKRPENVLRMMPYVWNFPEMDHVQHGNVWIGTSVENQEQADKRIPELLEIPARVRFLSMEPLLGSVDLTAFLTDPPGLTIDILARFYRTPDGKASEFNATGDGKQYGRVVKDPLPLHWVIVGGESGHNARPMHPDWARSLRDQCHAAGVPFLFKQWGEWYPDKKGLYNAPSQIFGDTVIHRVGKHAAGRLLDGREWNEFPAHEVEAYEPEPTLI